MTKNKPERHPPNPLTFEVQRGGGSPLFVQVREKIANLIAAGTLAPGTRLPPIRALAHQLNVNQMTVAKAYKNLAEMGLVNGHRGGGTTVRGPDGAAPVKTRQGGGYGSRRLLSQRLFELSNAPGVIALTGNYPHPEQACMEEFKTCLSMTVEQDLDTYFRYDPPNGREELLLRIAEFLSEQGITAVADNIIITSGAQQAIDLVVRTLVPSGSSIVVERPAYYGAINVMRATGARILEVPIEPDGMDLNILEQLLSRHKPRLIYTNPTFQNPTGVTTSEAKRRAILDLARRFGAAILEDDHCPELRFSGEPMPAVRALAQADDPIFYVRGFGKTFLPGIRLGFIVTPGENRRKLLATKALVDLHCNAIIQEALALFIARKRYPAFIANMRNLYAAHQRQLFESLRRGMPPGTLITAPEGGLSLWLTLPQGSDVSELYYRAVQRGVAFVAGEVFYASHPDPQTLRISFGHNRADELREGVDRLCSVVQDLLVPQKAAPFMVI